MSNTPLAAHDTGNIPPISPILPFLSAPSPSLSPRPACAVHNPLIPDPDSRPALPLPPRTTPNKRCNPLPSIFGSSSAIPPFLPPPPSSCCLFRPFIVCICCLLRSSNSFSIVNPLSALARLLLRVDSPGNSPIWLWKSLSYYRSLAPSRLRGWLFAPLGCFRARFLSRFAYGFGGLLSLPLLYVPTRYSIYFCCLISRSSTLPIYLELGNCSKSFFSIVFGFLFYFHLYF
jgi:hypothetical protein